MPDFIAKNFFIKLASVLLAVIVWTMVQGEVTTTRDFSNVRYDLLVSPSMTVTNRDHGRLKVTLSGPKDIMRDITSPSIKVEHDLRGIKTAGAVVFTLDEEDFTIPSRVQITRIEPRRLNVALDQVVEKELPVKVRFMGRPERGYEVKDFIINPSVVRVTGPRSRLEKLKEIESHNILLTGRTRSFVQTVALKTLLREGRVGEIRHVDVYVKVEPELMQRVWEQVPLAIVQNPGVSVPVRCKISSVQVKAEGSRELVEKLRETDFRAYVDVSDLKPGDYQLPVSVIPVPGLLILSTAPGEVEVHIADRLESAK